MRSVTVRLGYTGGNVTLGNITSTGAGTLVLAGFGDYVLGGTLGVTSGSLSITKSNLGVVTFAGANSGWTSGTLTASGGTTLIDATNTNAVGSANLGGTTGLLEILGATGTSGSSWTTKNLTVGGSFTLVADPLAGSNATGQTIQLGGFTGAAQTVIINSNHGYGITFNGAGTQGSDRHGADERWQWPGDFVRGGLLHGGDVHVHIGRTGGLQRLGKHHRGHRLSGADEIRPGHDDVGGTNTIGGR